MSDRRAAPRRRSNAYTPGQRVLAPPRIPCVARRSIRGGAGTLHPGVVGALLAISLAGCVSEKYHARDIGRYRAVLDNAAPTSRPAEYDPGAPLSLTGALQVANADNESIGTSGESYVQALAEKQRAAGTFLPTLSTSPSYTFTRNKGSNSTSGVVIPGGDGTGTVQVHTGGGTTEQKSANLNASLNASLADLSNLSAASLTVEQREQLLLDQRETILLSVVQSYYAVLRSEQQTRVLENSVKFRGEQVRDQEARLKLGGVRPLDLAQSQSELAGVRASLTQARTDALNARSALARLMGVDAVRGPLVDQYDLPGDIGAVDPWEADALKNRHDLHASDRSLESARASVDAAIRQYFPAVTVNFNYYLYNDPSSSARYAGGISANLPLFSGLQIEADIRRAWSVYRQAGLVRQQTRRVVLDDVRQNYLNVANSRERLVDLGIQVEAAQRAVDLSNRAYQLGSPSRSRPGWAGVHAPVLFPRRKRYARRPAPSHPGRRETRPCPQRGGKQSRRFPAQTEPRRDRRAGSEYLHPVYCVLPPRPPASPRRQPRSRP